MFFNILDIFMMFKEKQTANSLSNNIWKTRVLSNAISDFF